MADSHESTTIPAGFVRTLQELNDTMRNVSSMLTKHSTQDDADSGAGSGLRTIFKQVEAKMLGRAKTIEDAHRLASNASETTKVLVESLQQKISDLESKVKTTGEEKQKALSGFSNLSVRLEETEEELRRVRAANSNLDLKAGTYEEDNRTGSSDASELLTRIRANAEQLRKAATGNSVPGFRLGTAEDGSQRTHSGISILSRIESNENESAFPTPEDGLDEDEDDRAHQKRRRAADATERLPQRKHLRMEGDSRSESRNVDDFDNQSPGSRDTRRLDGRMSNHGYEVSEQSQSSSHEEQEPIAEEPLSVPRDGVRDWRRPTSVREEAALGADSDEEVADGEDAPDEDASLGDASEQDVPEEHEDEEAAALSVAENVERILSMFQIGRMPVTEEENAALRLGFTRVFENGRSVESVIESIDRHAFGPLTKKEVKPRPCLWGDLMKRASGPGGKRMTQKSCPACKKLPGFLCCWVNFFPGVGKGFGSRGPDGRVAVGDRAYQQHAQPRTLSVGNQEVRWVLKRRKQHQTDPDEPDEA